MKHASVLIARTLNTNEANCITTHPLAATSTDAEPAIQLATGATSTHDVSLPDFKTLLQQLNAVGWDKASLSADLKTVTLHLQDAACRCHTAEVLLPQGFPIAAPAVHVQLPTPFKVCWLPGDSLVTLVAQLEKTLDSYQSLWEQLEDIDSNTQLLDPATALAHPYSYCSRCITLGNGASCQLKLSPAAPRALPSSVVFHGPSSVVAALQNSWYSSAHKLWQEQQSVRENLQAILKVTVPAPKPGVSKGCAAVLAAAHGGGQHDQSAASQASDAVDDSSDLMDENEGEGACTICYALHLPDPSRPDELGAVPNVTCPAALCGRAFHAACLAEWLGSVPSSRRVFDTIFGSCPFCQGPIGVSTRLTS